MANIFPGRAVDSVNGKRGKVEVIEDKNYVYVQSAPLSRWEIEHPLNKKVSVTVTDTAGTVVEGTVVINDGKKVIITFNYPFSGEAILN